MMNFQKPAAAAAATRANGAQAVGENENKIAATN